MKETRTYQRFNLGQRIEHILLIVSFTTLVITGIPQKFAASGWAETVIALMGGIEAVRIIHRIAATVFMLETIYHVIVLGYKTFVQREGMTMLPTFKDAKDAMQALLYNLGFAKSRPKMGRYTFDEKAEYWALVWGSVVMVVTGFMLWNPIATTNVLPGEFIPAAKTAHGAEAILAALAIVIWHIYHVHIKFFNKSMFTGKMTRHEMEEEHPLELAQIEAGTNQRLAPAPVVKRRRSVYLPIAAVLSVALLAGLYTFVTFEETAITTIPPVSNVPAFSPATPTPAPTQAPQPAGSEGPLTWDGSIGAVFQQKCGTCHGASATGGYSVETYAAAVEGGDKGPGIIPGNPDTSNVVVIQAGSHPGKFSADELERIKEWILAGAPEQ